MLQSHSQFWSPSRSYSSIIFLIRLTLVAVATVATILLLVGADPTIDHSLILDLAQLILTLIYPRLICIILLPQLLVSRNFVFQLPVLVLYLLLKAAILLIELCKAVLQVFVLLLHNSQVLRLHITHLLQAVNVSLALVNLHLQEIVVHLKLLVLLK